MGISQRKFGVYAAQHLLSRYPRERDHLASKFPGYDLSTLPHKEEIFETQLKKCGVEYFDFYLFHNVCEMNIDAYLDESIGLYAYLMERNGRGASVIWGSPRTATSRR